MAFADPTCEGELEIDNISLNTAAWVVFSDEQGLGGLMQLWANFQTRGEDRLVPGAAGVIPYPRRLTVYQPHLNIAVCGDVDENGDPVADTAEGVEANLAYLMTNVFAQPSNTDGTRSAVLTMPSGATRTADIHILGFEQTFGRLQYRDSVIEGKIHISIPVGAFT